MTTLGGLDVTDHQKYCLKQITISSFSDGLNSIVRWGSTGWKPVDPKMTGWKPICLNSDRLEAYPTSVANAGMMALSSILLV